MITTLYTTAYHVSLKNTLLEIFIMYYTDEKKKTKEAAGESKSGFFSYFMPWRKTGPPRAKLPSDREPKVNTYKS